jgi:hypothetical protein
MTDARAIAQVEDGIGTLVLDRPSVLWTGERSGSSARKAEGPA